MAARVSAAWSRSQSQKACTSGRESLKARFLLVESHGDLLSEQMAGKNISGFDRDEEKCLRKTEQKFP